MLTGRPLKTGDTVDGFRLDEPLESGGMADFWRVSRAGTHLPLIMKIRTVARQSRSKRCQPARAGGTQQSPGQWLGSKLMGTDVIGPNNETIGDVSDVLIDKGGKVEALVVGVGGFLGIGIKDVALPMTVFEVVPANGGNTTSSDQLKLSMTKDQLQQHAKFKTLGDTQNTTGAETNKPGSNMNSGRTRT